MTSPDMSSDDLPEEFTETLAGERDWRRRLAKSRARGDGFAAPGGQFTRALREAVLSGQAGNLSGALKGQRVVELGAGMMPHGYLLAATCGARNYVGVEPFYADILSDSINRAIGEHADTVPRIPFKVVATEMLEYLRDEPDDLLSILACGIEDCILPGEDYKRKVEAEIVRTLKNDGVFVSSHSDLDPQELFVTEKWIRRLGTSGKDRIREYRKREAHERQLADPYAKTYDLGAE